MARNQEKAQSMLYRFREAQASSLGLSSKPNLRRPRLASSVTSLKEAEKWRGEVIREISRKVSKIQDFGLTDYEVRDLNDEINKLLREKGHWEDRILTLGGANYKRGIPSMLGGDKGVGGKGGYKYFGRAKDLPGVKELFAKKEGDGEGEGREDRWQRFMNLPGSYYGDEDEDDGVLLEEESKAEEVEWNERYLAMMMGLRRDTRRRDIEGEGEEMDVSDDEEASHGGIEVPTIPRPSPKPWKESMQALAQSYSQQYSQPSHPQDATSTSESESTKRPQPAEDQPEEGGGGKRQKGPSGEPLPTSSTTPAETREVSETASVTPTVAVGYSIFSADDLQHPTIPDRSAIEKMILQAKKRQLRQEYLGSS